MSIGRIRIILPFAERACKSLIASNKRLLIQRRSLQSISKDPIETLSKLEKSAPHEINDTHETLPNPEKVPREESELLENPNEEQRNTAPFHSANEGTEGDADVHPFAHVPASVTLAYLEPWKHEAPHGLRVCNVHMRSYNLHYLTFYADFVLRTAWYLNLPATGPIPLPKRRERWTVPKSPFIHKKIQENFERITYKRLVSIKDGHPDTVALFLSYLNQNGFPGVGIKATTWEWDDLDFAKRLSQETDQLIENIANKAFSIEEAAQQVLSSDLFQNLDDEVANTENASGRDSTN
ncbi:37S ribosomal protein S10, mitochondrial [Neolecta irregularis DAH-3]|uniref:Small ribosomal subunit protein uS10m n=1 Tax=Neolecta irregularis (strain DAH-3) TaxID=1198029 RepID=A0A1U7LHD8_NEOID|nr:37S ribosomal protein S10, mitochondrial [Neolecta irregularis DAH-3]|eukprot:OLL21962.1 37S ribosomal protein S10, mitochondrial [Neolecta irregularis DAH-3]